MTGTPVVPTKPPRVLLDVSPDAVAWRDTMLNEQIYDVSIPGVDHVPTSLREIADLVREGGAGVPIIIHGRWPTTEGVNL